MRQKVYPLLALAISLGAIVAVGTELKAVRQTKTDDRWVEQLKSTPASQLDPALPHKFLGEWLSDQLKPAQPLYEVKPCPDDHAAGADQSAAPPSCVSVTAPAGPMRRVDLIFMVWAPEAQSAKPGLRSPTCAFHQGTVGPADSRSKAPVRVIRKLAELQAVLHP